MASDWHCILFSCPDIPIDELVDEETGLEKLRAMDGTKFRFNLGRYDSKVVLRYATLSGRNQKMTKDELRPVPHNHCMCQRQMQRVTAGDTIFLLVPLRRWA